MAETLEKIEIYRDKRGDRNCPSCGATDKSLHIYHSFAGISLAHNRTTLKLGGYCEKCGCNFVFEYVLHLSSITID